MAVYEYSFYQGFYNVYFGGWFAEYYVALGFVHKFGFKFQGCGVPIGDFLWQPHIGASGFFEEDNQNYAGPVGVGWQQDCKGGGGS